MSAKTVKRIFLFFLIYLPLQYAVIGIVGYYDSEPWPSFAFPGFKNVYVFDGLYEIRDYQFELTDENDDRITTLTPAQLFQEIPTSKLNRFMRANFSDEISIEGFSRKTEDWLLEKAQDASSSPVASVDVVHYQKYFQRDIFELDTDSVLITNRYTVARSN